MRLLRTERDLSLAQLAQEADLAKSHLSTIEAGLCAITIETAWRLAASLHVSLPNLFVFPEESKYDALAELLRKLSPADHPRAMAIVQRYMS